MRRGLDAGGQDWQWWRSGTWNSMEWDAKRYPDPKAMADECHANGVRVMLSVWSKTGGKCDFVSEVKKSGSFIPGTEWIDFSKPTACDIYWKWFDKCCVKKGIDAFWLDAVEPENDALHGRKLVLGDGDIYRNVYPLLVNREADRRLRALRPGETPLVLTRCAFFRPGDQYENKKYHKVLARWVEFATFCPIQRVHGYKSDTTPSRFGPEMEKLLCDQIRLRESLRPYVLETARAVASENAMFMRPLWEAPAGFETEYMFGGKLLVCPVVADVEEMDVWIPEGEWRDFHTGEAVTGGCVRRVKTPIDRIPVFEKCEAVLLRQMKRK